MTLRAFSEIIEQIFYAAEENNISTFYGISHFHGTEEKSKHPDLVKNLEILKNITVGCTSIRIKSYVYFFPISLLTSELFCLTCSFHSF